MLKYFWLCVDTDEYELPIAVADTARELAEMMGSTGHNIETFVSRNSNGRELGYKYIKVLRDGQENV